MMRPDAFLYSMVLAALVFLTAGCMNNEVSQETVDQAVMACKRLCDNYQGYPDELDKGPCLSNSLMNDWVCDVAHSPRELVDNQPENQCSAFREGIAHHFVELDTGCNLIKTY